MSRFIIRFFVALVSAVIPSIVSYLILNPDSGLALLIGYPVLVISLFLARDILLDSNTINGKRVRSLATLASVLAILLQTAGAVVIVVSLNLTPASAYIAWFRLAQEGSATGMLSFMFTVKICFFGTLFASAMLRHGIIRPLMGFGAMALIIFYAIFQNRALGIVTAVFIALAVLSVSIQQFDRSLQGWPSFSPYCHSKRLEVSRIRTGA